MVLWVAIAGLLAWVSLEFLRQEHGQARRWVGPADPSHSTQVLLAAFLVSLGINIVLSRSGVAPVSVGIRWAGSGLLVAGVALRGWSMAILGNSYSRELQVTDRQLLMMAGPYRIIRHPGYAGSLLVWIGFALGAGSWAGAILTGIVLGAAYVYRITAEERVLCAKFGAAYQNYQQQTWRLIPGLF
jgi:protein-S-isoprenylcysteine O-methyltransferase Ste14